MQVQPADDRLAARAGRRLSVARHADHEYTHFVVTRVSHNTVPIWLHEGLAKFEERRWRGPVGRRADAGDGAPAGHGARAQAPHHLRRDAPVDGQAAVAGGHRAGLRRGLHGRRVPARDRSGWDGVRAAHRRACATGRATRRRWRRSWASRSSEFQCEWRAWLHGAASCACGRACCPRARAARSRRGGQGRPRRARTTRRSIGEERARKFARLGGMLRARHRLRRGGDRVREGAGDRRRRPSVGGEQAGAHLPRARRRGARDRRRRAGARALPRPGRARRDAGRGAGCVKRRRPARRPQPLPARTGAAAVQAWRFDDRRADATAGLPIAHSGSAGKRPPRAARRDRTTTLPRARATRSWRPVGDNAAGTMRRSATDAHPARRPGPPASGHRRGREHARRRATDLRAVEEIARARVEIKAEVEKRIIGQQRGDRPAADGAVRARPLPLRRRARPGQDAAHLDAGRGAQPHLQPHPVHARPDAVGHHRHRRARGGSRHRPARASASSTGRSSPTSCWPTRSTARRPRPRRRCCRRCRSTASPPAAQTHALALPFLVFATQNPIEQEGTYPLPEAQLDRFMFQVDVGYPSARRGGRDRQAARPAPTGRRCSKVLSPERILALQELVLRVPVADHVVRYAVELVRATAPRRSRAPPDFVRENVAWGAGPRAAQYLILGAKARAILDGRHGRQRRGRARAGAADAAAPRHHQLPRRGARASGRAPIVDRLLESVRP